MASLRDMPFRGRLLALEEESLDEKGFEKRFLNISDKGFTILRGSRQRSQRSYSG